MSAPIPCEVIDEPRLHSDTMYRFQYLTKFLDFGEEDIKNVKSVAAELAAAVPTLVDAVYVKLFSFTCTKAFFLPRNEGFEGELAEDLDHLTLQSDQIKFRKNFLAKYLGKLVTAEYNAGMVVYLDWVGKIHSTHGGNRSLNVPMVHNEALFGFVEDAIVNTLGTIGLSQERERAIIRSFVKLLSIQRSFFMRWCNDLPAENAAPKAAAAAPAHGTAAPGVCPFTGMSAAGSSTA